MQREAIAEQHHRGDDDPVELAPACLLAEPVDLAVGDDVQSIAPASVTSSPMRSPLASRTWPDVRSSGRRAIAVRPSRETSASAAMVPDDAGDGPHLLEEPIDSPEDVR